MRSLSSRCLVALSLMALIALPVSGEQDFRSKRWKLAQGAPEELQKVIAAQDDEELVKANIKSASNAVRDGEKALQRALEQKPRSKERVDAASARVVAAKKRLAGLRDGTALAWPRFSTNEMKVGVAGIWNTASFFKVFQVVDKDTAILELQDSGFPKVWVEQIDTAGWIDGKEIWHADLLLLFTGTKTYNTIAGSSTILSARPFTQDDFEYVPKTK